MFELAALLLVLIGVAFVALITVVVVFARRGRQREQQRRSLIQHWAARNGWIFAIEPSTGWTARLPGQNRHGVALMLSTMIHGRPVSVAEYFYTTESMADSNGSRSTTTHHLIVTAIRLTRYYPEVTVHQRGALSRIGLTVFGSDTAIGHHVFDRKFRIQANEPAQARALFTYALITEHLAGRVPTWSLVGQDCGWWPLM
jgi:hypothetical protein